MTILGNITAAYSAIGVIVFSAMAVIKDDLLAGLKYGVFWFLYAAAWLVLTARIAALEAWKLATRRTE